MNRRTIALAAISALAASSLHAADLAISIAIRETNNNVAIFANGGTANGIEWVNRDGQTLTTDGTWQLFTFTPATDTLLGFAGTTADSILDPGITTGVLEHIRILNSDGVTAPIRLWIDDVTNTVAAGPTVEGFEAFALNAEVMFQEPGFSGSTSANLVVGSTAGVTDSMAFSGQQSYQADFQFVDNDPTRWVRLTSFNATNVPNAAVRVREAGAPAPTISFYAKAVVIPEPASLALVGFASLAMVAVGRRA